MSLGVVCDELRQMRALNSGITVAFITLFLPSLGRKHSHAIERADCDDMKMSSKLLSPDK